MKTPGNTQIQVFIIKHQHPYKQLETLSTDLRTLLKDVIVTKADLQMLPDLIKSINRSHNNLMIILTKNVSLDGDLSIQLQKINEKNIRVILYPQQLSQNNNYFVARTKQEILHAAKIYQSFILGKTSASPTQTPGNPISKDQTDNSIPSHFQMSEIVRNRVNQYPSPKLLQNLAENYSRPLGVWVFNSKNKQFNSLMNLIYIKYKNNPEVSFKQIRFAGQLNTEVNQKVLLVVAQSQSNQIQNHPNLDQRIFPVKFTSERQQNKFKTCFKNECHTLKDIELLIDGFLGNKNQKRNIAPDSYRNSSLSKSNQRIVMKSAQKISKLSHNSYPSQFYIYDPRHHQQFQEFYTKIPVNMQVINDFNTLKNPHQTILLAEQQQFQSIENCLPKQARLILYASKLTPQISISHPSITMITSNPQELMLYISKENLIMIDKKQTSSTTQNPQSQYSTFLNNKNQQNQYKSMTWRVRHNGADFITKNIDKQQISQYLGEQNGVQKVPLRISNLQNYPQQNMKVPQYIQKTNNLNRISQCQPQIVNNLPQKHSKTSLGASHDDQKVQEIIIKPNGKINSKASSRNSEIRALDGREIYGPKQQGGNLSFVPNMKKNSNRQEFELQNGFSNKGNLDNMYQSKQIFFQESLIRQSDSKKMSTPLINIIPPSQMLPKPENQFINTVPSINQYSLPSHRSKMILSQYLQNNSTPTQASQTLVSNKSLKSIGNPLNNTMTFNNEYQLHDIRTDSQKNNANFNQNQNCLTSFANVSSSFESIPQKIFTEKAISCRILQPPSPQLQVKRNVLGLRTNQFDKTASLATTNTVEFHNYEPQPHLVESIPFQNSTSMYQKPDIIYINNRVTKKKGEPTFCSGVLQVRTQNYKETPACLELNPSSFIDQVSRVSDRPHSNRISMMEFKSPGSRKLQQVGHHRTSYSYENHQIKNNWEQSLSLPKRMSFERVSNASERISQYPIYDSIKQSPSFQINDANFDIRTENGIKVYKRKSKLSENRPSVNDYFLQQPQILNRRSTNISHQNINKLTPEAHHRNDQRHSYYNTNTYNISNTQTISSPRQSNIYKPSYDHLRISNLNDQRMVRTSRLSGISGQNLKSNIPRQSSLQSEGRPSQPMICVLCHYQEIQLCQSLQSRLRNKLFIQKYHDDKSLVHKVIQKKHQNLVVVLNEQLSQMDEQLQNMHPNVSLITLSRNNIRGTHIASSIAEVMSMIQKWYFRY